MLALVAAAVLAAAYPPARAPDQTHVRDGVTTQVWRDPGTPGGRGTPNAFRLPDHCRQMFQKTQKQVPMRGNRLGEMPPADHHLLVDRRIYGCPVPTIVGYGIENGDGAPRYSAPLRREGAPANRR